MVVIIINREMRHLHAIGIASGSDYIHCNGSKHMLMICEGTL